jgi:glycosyltransferase involved in cell wall biosynthesis
LSAARVQTAVVTPRIGSAESRLGLPVYRFAWGESDRTLSELNLLAPASWRKIKAHFTAGKRFLFEHLTQHTYGHVLAMWAAPSGWFAYQAWRRFNLDYSIWALGSDVNVWARRPIVGGMIRRAVRNAAHLFADGDELAEKVTALSGRQCHFLPSFHRLPGKLLPCARERFFLYLGRIEKSKGVYDLLRAFAGIRRDLRDYRLVYVGSGSQEDSLRGKIKKLGLRGKVHMLGRVPAAEVVNFLQRARALVIPTHSDSIPLVFGEALQTATPLVVSDVGDLGTLVRDNKLGFVAAPRSVSALRDALVKMIVSDIDISEQAGRLTGRLSPERAVAKFLEVVNGPRGQTEVLR